MTLSRQAMSAMSSETLIDGLPALGTVCIRMTIAGAAFAVSITEGVLEVVDGDGACEPDFSYTLDKETWEAFCTNPPPRGYTTAQSIVATLGGSCVSGDRVVWATYAPIIDRLLEALRTTFSGPRPARNDNPAPPRSRSPIVGSYLQLPAGGTSSRVYYETAGEGPAVVCLHTAGADSRQFRYLMEDKELTARYQFVAFDMPWHGRSDPPDDWPTAGYSLTTQTYTETVLSFMDALGLERPVLMGCSMGGAIALYLSSKHGNRFSGVCALEGGLGNPGRLVPWTNHLQIDHSAFLASWVGGLIAPRSPDGPRNQTLWGYSQSGPGVYQGDTYFYGTDLPVHAASLTPATCPLWVFSGEYDYSATTEMSREAAEKLGGKLVYMKGSGHFPMSEDPEMFRSYIVPVLDEITQSADRG